MHYNPNYLRKLRHVLPAFAVMAWGSVLFLGCIRRYLFLGKYPMLELDEELWNYWIPAFFPWIPILLWLKKRFDGLVFRKDSSHGRWQMELIAWLVTAAMLLFSQNYLTTSTGKLLELQNVKEIRKHERVRYYRIREFAVHRYIGGVQYAFREGGRYNKDLTMYIYFVNPILTHKTQALTMTPRYWYGVKFSKRIGNWSSRAKKERRFKEFSDECMAKMNRYEFGKPDHFENRPASFDRANFRIAVQHALNKPVNDDFVILEPRSRRFESRNDHKVAWTFGSFVIGIGIYLLVLIRPRLETAHEEDGTADAGGPDTKGN